MECLNIWLSFEGKKKKGKGLDYGNMNLLFYIGSRGDQLCFGIQNMSDFRKLIWPYTIHCITAPAGSEAIPCNQTY